MIKCFSPQVGYLLSMLFKYYLLIKLVVLEKYLFQVKKIVPPQVGVPGHHLAVVSIILIFNNILMFTILS